MLLKKKILFERIFISGSGYKFNNCRQKSTDWKTNTLKNIIYLELNFEKEKFYYRG